MIKYCYYVFGITFFSKISTIFYFDVAKYITESIVSEILRLTNDAEHLVWPHKDREVLYLRIIDSDTSTKVAFRMFWRFSGYLFNMVGYGFKLSFIYKLILRSFD